MVDQLVEQQIAIKMAQRRKLASNGSPVNRIGEQLLDEFAHMIALGIKQRAFLFFQESSELANVGRIGHDSERRQALLDFQIVEESGDYAGVGFGGHMLSMRIIGR